VLSEVQFRAAKKDSCSEEENIFEKLRRNLLSVDYKKNEVMG
jgi:hypothetical protein